MKTTHFMELSNVANNANNDVKKLNHMYFVNQLNKLARKNEYCENTNILELGKMARNFAIDKGFELKNGTYYSLYLFKKDSLGRPCVTKTSKTCPKFGVDLVNIEPNKWTYLQPIALSLSGVIMATKKVLGVDAKKADKEARAINKEARRNFKKSENAAKSEARKELKRQQKAAVLSFNNGTMCAEEFAAIMARAI